MCDLSVGTIYQIKPWLGIRLDLRYFHAIAAALARRHVHAVREVKTSGFVFFSPA